MSRQELIAVLRQQLPDLLAVYLFGSRARDEARPDSDLDLAVLVEGKLEPMAAWDLAQTLAGLTGYDVDLVDLRSASTVMQYQIITTGTRLWHQGIQAALYECFILREKMDLDIGRAGTFGLAAKCTRSIRFTGAALVDRCRTGRCPEAHDRLSQYRRAQLPSAATSDYRRHHRKAPG